MGAIRAMQQMTVPTTSSSLFPLMFLQPVTDIRNTWAALTLNLSATDRAHRDAILSRAFNELRLAEALGRLMCIVRVDDIAGFDLAITHQTRPGQIVLRVPVAQCIDETLQVEFARLKKEGFAFMVDGIPPAGAPLNEHVTMLVFDQRLSAQPATLHWTQRLSGPHMAEDVMTPMQYQIAKDNAVRWFARLAVFAEREELSRQDTITRARLLRLLELVTQDANVSELEVLLKQDPALSYQLFRLLGSAAFAFKVEITSFTQAINLLGRRQLQRWLQLLLYARPVHGDGALNSLLPKAAVRAALMEALCRERSGSRDDQDKAFLVGMFSLLDILFGIPLPEILAPLKLGQDITDALLDHQGELGQLLSLAIRAERAALTLDDLAAVQVTVDMYSQSLVHAYRWASRVSSED